MCFFALQQQRNEDGRLQFLLCAEEVLVNYCTQLHTAAI